MPTPYFFTLSTYSIKILFTKLFTVLLSLVANICNCKCKEIGTRIVIVCVGSFFIISPLFIL